MEVLLRAGAARTRDFASCVGAPDIVGQSSARALGDGTRVKEFGATKRRFILPRPRAEPVPGWSVVGASRR